MVISLGGGVYVNAAHISLISAVMPADNRPNTFQIRLVLMGNKEHVVMGPQEAMQTLHSRIKDALDQLGA